VENEAKQLGFGGRRVSHHEYVDVSDIELFLVAFSANLKIRIGILPSQVCAVLKIFFYSAKQKEE